MTPASHTAPQPAPRSLRSAAAAPPPPGSLDALNTAVSSVGGSVVATAVQPDGKVILGGSLSSAINDDGFVHVTLSLGNGLHVGKVLP